MEEWPEYSPSLVTKIIKNKRNLQKTIYRGFQNSGKQFYLLTEANIMYLIQMDVIMLGKNLGKNFGNNVMWGCVAASGAGNHFIKGIMNKHIYVNIL